MKKYVKPELFFESYELSQNIAMCGWDMQNEGDPKNCFAVGDTGWNNPAVTVFLDGVEGCSLPWEGYCYENSADDITIKIFAS